MYSFKIQFLELKFLQNGGSKAHINGNPNLFLFLNLLEWVGVVVVTVDVLELVGLEDVVVVVVFGSVGVAN